jgi:transcriptional regulator with XRE-family HTH domain
MQLTRRRDHAMSTLNFDPTSSASSGDADSVPTGPQPQPARHRLRAVRQQQGMTLRSVARHTGYDIRTLRMHEEETTDLRISELQKWQQALEVPLSELLVESSTVLSQPILQRSRLVRIMKSALALHQQAPNSAMRCMAETLIEQLTELMPELAEIHPWHTYGQRRGSEDYGRIVDRRVSEDFFRAPRDDD